MTMGQPVQNSEELGLSSEKIQTELEFTRMRTLVGKYFKIAVITRVCMSEDLEERLCLTETHKT